jgi:hypothetical protein
MSHHSKVISMIKGRSEILEIQKGKNTERLISLEPKTLFDDQQEMLNLLIHLGDLSHNTKGIEISKAWTYLLYEEFHQQGDVERCLNIPISMFCDRNNSNIPKAQIGFINDIILPTFDVLVNFFPSLSYLIINIDDNLSNWGKLAELNGS